jgi:outer membrane protein TolC
MVRDSPRKVGRPAAASRTALFASTTSLRRRLAPLGLMALLLPPGAAGAESLSLRQVLEQGLADSPQLERSERQLARDEALVALNRSLLLPQLDLVGLGSYTQVGSSVGVITNLPTLGDISLSLENGGYALLRNSFGNAGVVLGADLLPLRQVALIAASRSQRQSSRASRRESERQVRFELVSTYRQLQLAQALLPVWQAALRASTAIESDARAFLRRGLAARIDLLRASSLRAVDLQGVAQAQAQLEGTREQLAALLGRPAATPLEAADPLQEQAPWPQDLPTTVERSTQGRPLLEALQEQERAQRQQARAARAALYPSLKLLAGAGYSGNQLSAPVLQQGGAIDGAPVPLPLPSLEQSGYAAGSFYNWGVALLLRQPLWDGGRAGSGARLAERDADLLRADEDVARQRIRREVGRAWSDLQGAPATIAAAKEAVTAGERAVRDARLRYRAMVEPITEVLLVERDLQVARAALLGALTRQALDRAVLERETGMESGDP